MQQWKKLNNPNTVNILYTVNVNKYSSERKKTKHFPDCLMTCYVSNALVLYISLSAVFYPRRIILHQHVIRNKM